MSKLKRAMRAARGAGSKLRGASKTLARMRSRAAKAREHSKSVVSGIIETGETLTTFAVSEYAEGYLGQEKMAPGGYVDLRAVAIAPWILGVGLEMFGSAGARKAGSHVTALSQGPVLSYVGSKLRNAGAKMASKSADAPPAPVAEDKVPPMLADPGKKSAEGDDNVLDFDALKSALREIQLTPAAEKQPAKTKVRRAFHV